MVGSTANLHLLSRIITQPQMPLYLSTTEETAWEEKDLFESHFWRKSFEIFEEEDGFEKLMEIIKHSQYLNSIIAAFNVAWPATFYTDTKFGTSPYTTQLLSRLAHHLSDLTEEEFKHVSRDDWTSLSENLGLDVHGVNPITRLQVIGNLGIRALNASGVVMRLWGLGLIKEMMKIGRSKVELVT